MVKIFEALEPARVWELAAVSKSPARMAQVFASFAGQFYDRDAYDALARQVSELYTVQSAEQARAFRQRLNRRLCDRYHDPVDWDISPMGQTG